MRAWESIKNWEFFELAFVLGCIAAVTLALTCAICSIRADGRSDYCFVEQHEHGVYLVREHVPWRDDRTLGAFIDPTEANDFKTEVCQ